MNVIKKKWERPRFTTGRVVITSVSVILQVLWIVALFIGVVSYSVILDILLRVLSALMMLYLIRKNDNPAYRMSWIILISILPVLGGLLYLLLGNKRPARYLAHHLKIQTDKRLGEKVDGEKVSRVSSHSLQDWHPRFAGMSHYILESADAHIYRQTAVRYFENGESAFPELLQRLKQAERYILIEFFIMKDGQMLQQLLEVLQKKAQEGLEVRIIFDDFGCMLSLPTDFVQQMESKGIRCLRFNPFTPIVSLAVNNRDHRKIVVIDGQFGYTGGLNIGDEYINVTERFGYWKDNMIEIHGPAVWDLTVMFLDMWNAFYPLDENYQAFYVEDFSSTQDTEGFVQIFGDTPLDNEPVGENMYRELFAAAEEYVYLCTPYLVISYELQTAMVLAAKRGVDVRLVVPGIPDKRLVYRITRSYFGPLLEAGVHIYEYTPGFIHAKTIVCDGRVASVGTTNLDYRSLYLHFELNALMYGHEVVSEIEDDLKRVIQESQEVSIASMKQSFFGLLWDSILRIAAPFV